MNIINIPPALKKLFDNSFGILLAYIFLALFFTFPLILNISDSMATGKNSVENEYTINSDSVYFVWNLWFFKNNLIDLKINPLGASDMIFYPQGFNNAATGYDNLFNSILSLPLQLVSNNLILIYNILVLFNFVFAAYAAYLLANYLVEDKRISFLSGIIFGFSPYMIARSLGHFNLMTSGAIPLFVLYFIKMIKEPKYTNSILAAIGFALIALSSWQYALFTLLFIVLSLIFLAVYQKTIIFTKKFVKRFILFIFLSIILVAPIVLPALKAYLNHEMAPHASDQTLIFSASILSFFTPSPLSTFIGRFIDPDLYKSFSAFVVEGTAYLGFLEIIMIIFYIQNRKKIASAGKYWLFLIATFFILSLGPFLKISLSGLFFNYIPLPFYFIFKYVPFFNLVRESVRLDIFIMLFTAIIFAITLKYIFSQYNFNPYKKGMILSVFTILIIAERMILPYPIEKIKTPSFYKEISRDKENYAILDLPVDSSLTFSFYNLFQIVHGKKIISGKILSNAFSAKTYSFIEKNDFLKNSACIVLAMSEKNINREKTIEEFKKNKIKYIIIHKDIIEYIDTHNVAADYDNLYNCSILKNNIREFFKDDDPVYEDELIKAYDITKTI